MIRPPTKRARRQPTRYRSIADPSPPSQPARYQAITDYLLRDQERGQLTLRGPDLMYWLKSAHLTDPLRAWLLDQIDRRITAIDNERLDGLPSTSAHVCQTCHGRGVQGNPEHDACESCGGLGMVCPTCRGSRWLTDGKPASGRTSLTGCPDCTETSGTGWSYSVAAEARAIQRHIDRLREVVP